MFGRVRIWAGLAGAALLLAACSRAPQQPVTPSPVRKIFDATALAAGVQRVLTESYHLTGVGEVRCPSGQAVQAGISFDCSVAIDGTTKTVTLTVLTAAGTYQVSQPK